MHLSLKRIYDAVSDDDGVRILVDRLWPRGLSKDRAKIDLWLRDIAPSNELRRWYNHDPNKWDEFTRRYFSELHEMNGIVELVLKEASRSNVTLLYAAKDENHNNAVALSLYIDQLQMP